MRAFPTTRWSLVAAACKDSDEGRARGELCALYLGPINSFVRYVTHAAYDAQDMTQSVFAHILQRKVLTRIDPQRRPFRKWLMLKIRSVIAKERRRAGALKRGGGAVVLSLDVPATKGRHVLEPSAPSTADRDHARRQIAELHGRVMVELEQHYAAQGDRARFQCLAPFIDGREIPYAALAEECGVAAGTLRKQVHVIKQCYAALIRADFRRRGVRPADIDSEIRSLLAELS